MRQWLKKRLAGSNQKGFTLVEMMVVVAIIGVLATVLVPQTLGAIDRAKRQGAIADMGRLRTAIELVKLDGVDWESVDSKDELFGELTGSDIEFEGDFTDRFVDGKSDIEPGQVGLVFVTGEDGASTTLEMYSKTGGATPDVEVILD